MTDLFDTKRIPDDPAYWDALAARVADSAVSHGRQGNGLALFAGSKRGWIAASVLIGIAATLVVVINGTVPAGNEPDWRASIRPTDEIGSVMAANEGPPSVGALLLNPELLGRMR